MKRKLSRTYFRGMGSFFFGFCNAIFCRQLQWTSKKFVHKKIQELVNFWQNIIKIIDLVYLFIKIIGMKGQLGLSGFMELVSLFWGILYRFLCIYRVIYLTDLSAGFIAIKTTKKKIYIYFLFFRNNLAGPVNLVKLAWTSKSQYLFEKLCCLLHPTWKNFCEEFLKW